MVRELQLRELGYASYADYLKSPAWRDVRERYIASDLPQVCMCGATSWELHHTTYERVGRERLDDLIPLCRTCHADAHALESAGVIGLDLDGFYYDVERAAANAVARQERKALADADNRTFDVIAYDRAQREARKRDRRPWARAPESPERASARRARSAAANARRNAPTDKQAARIDATAAA